jgi:hypothetical protein
MKQSISAKENDKITRIFIRAMHTKGQRLRAAAGRPVACRDHAASQYSWCSLLRIELVLNILQVAIRSAKNVMFSPLRSCTGS